MKRLEGKMASFIGFAPVKNPEIEIYVGIIDAQNSANGATHAAPIFKELAETILHYLHIPADKI